MVDEKRKNTSSGRVNPDIFPCPICGDDDFSWGYTIGHTASGFRYRSTTDEKFTQGKWVKARECLRCGNVQLFTRGKDS